MCTELTPWERVVQFHGHVCPGIAAGYRVAMRMLQELGRQYPPGDECIIRAGKRFCGLDALQLLLGATYGKGNLQVEAEDRYHFELSLPGQSLRIELELTPRLAVYEEQWQQLFQEKLSPVKNGRKSEIIAEMVELAQQVMDLEDEEFFLKVETRQE
ncbi:MULTISPECIES: formylmethanofuran dehydrogenase subunit E family protein [Carboxydocella]|uniref:Formylmethanofuran dehydrogenase subunit E n=2 Tax=Carboxydocella TaxID=178898 RepID=A0A1T4RAW8_9FIRM|nr:MULTISPECIES: formylmethanofuran dehydrogenase subunit E family protein [Carboxydocella]AVX19414.1 formylmethanofuran dehydrogenase subunit E [Carboxydocella thermautotrophica]AVX29832.1 formylmethanofuran dehydrogenase subunit E [Carboxydocella thermautotrophica]SKA13113.1 formylmethanofuran dehydrogenase subunit E [Carboxydocella sporoproducens DSM 16521]